jgi:hypothetical protein
MPREDRVELALQHLRSARDLLATTDSPRALDRVRGAIKSCEGAKRHASNREFRERKLKTVA